ncbi:MULTISPECIES: hypothetical protein [Rhizobium]|uniref:hypothetical protein n=1 Tax=Rhizobium TaxID=379 RepID=UPI001B31DE2F|nr:MULTISPECIES: hypothetical protein [Rhizobium]MBX4908350.1 hypothetical protein [Rhizobium bangladeshense]MBX5233566.1 hypothetical protein [Rhizobium sp. NLR4a]MBX5251205.1 hypothetical protein [Rhizobium sp. NLR4b]MBX5257483.1 hypothetical protein [Rhizobium sp. NLR16b]MBX5263575.1 hypothetical protein [Rhizobium sp. NLR16a]
MREQLQAKPKLSSLLLLTVAVLFTHWMAFVNEGIFAEDAGLFTTLIYNDWIAIAEMFSSAGVPVFTYYVWPMALAGNVLLLKSFVIIGVYIIAIFSYLLASKSGFLSERESLVLAIFTQLLPLPTVTVIFTYSIYFNAYALFLLATYLFLSIEWMHGRSHYLLRGLAICIYLMAFTLNSLLVLYAAGFVLVYAVWLRRTGRRVRNARELVSTFWSFCLARTDFTILPVMYWVYKVIFYQRSGLYSNYNSFTLGFESLAGNSYRFIVNGIIFPLARSLDDWNAYLYLGAAVCSILIVACFVFLNSGNARNAQLNERGNDGFKIIGFGVFLLLCGTVPYILVGKSPAPGVLMRNAMLMPLPMSVVGIGTWRVIKFRSTSLQSHRVAIVLFASLLTVFTGRWWESYAAWQARAAKDLAVSQYFADHPEWSAFSVYWIVDKLPLSSEVSEYGFADYTSKFRMLWGGQTRMAFTPAHISFFGVDTKPGVRPVHSNLPHRIAFFCNAWASARDIDLTGPQAELEIRTTQSSWNDASVAFGYLYYRFIEPRGLKNYLAELVNVTVRAL